MIVKSITAIIQCDGTRIGGRQCESKQEITVEIGHEPDSWIELRDIILFAAREKYGWTENVYPLCPECKPQCDCECEHDRDFDSGDFDPYTFTK